MSKLILLGALVMAWTMLPNLAQAAVTQPTRVILYPSGGLLEVQTTLPVENGQITFELPAEVDLNTLNLYLDNITDYEQTTMPVLSMVGTDLANLQGDLDLAKKKLKGLNGELRTLKAQIALWSRSAIKDFDGIVEKSEILVHNLEPLQLRQIDLTELQKKAEAEVKRLTKILHDAGGKEVENTQVIIRLNTQLTEIKVQYSYLYPNCGWTPTYRFNALPEANKVEVRQEASLWQRMGINWNTAELNLATAALSNSLQPMELFSWILRPVQGPTPRAVRLEAAGMAATMDMAPKMLNAMPMPVEKDTLTVWELGNKKLASGNQTNLLLNKTDWQADFVRILRPARHKSAFLQASIKLAEPVDMPNGIAQYMVAGVPVGKSNFFLVGVETDMYFGSDPRVTAVMKLDTRQSGKQGFVDKKQTRIWKWSIVIENNHATPTLIKVEDPAPQSYDTGIEVVVTANPKPEVKDQVETWTLTVPAKGKSTIDYTVEAKAPAEMKLDDGR